MNRSEIFSNQSSFESRYVRDYAELADIVSHLKGLGRKVVLTSGSFDLIHPGHLRYLERAKACGDVLIVGVESDKKIEERKKRYVAVPEDERLEVLCHQRHVDIVTLKPPGRQRWELIKTIRPDVLVIVAEGERGLEGELIPESYSPEELIELKEWCGDVTIIERQYSVSTTARIRDLMIEGASRLKAELVDVIDSVFAKFMGGGE